MILPTLIPPETEAGFSAFYCEANLIYVVVRNYYVFMTALMQL